MFENATVSFCLFCCDEKLPVANSKATKMYPFLAVYF